MDAYVVHLGMLVTNNKLNDKCEVLHSWYKDMNNTVEITGNQWWMVSTGGYAVKYSM